MTKKLILDKFSVHSFITAIDARHIMGASACCLHDTGPGNNCYTWGHESNCGSTGNTDDPTGGRNMNTMMFCSQTQGDDCNTQAGC